MGPFQAGEMPVHSLDLVEQEENLYSRATTWSSFRGCTYYVCFSLLRFLGLLPWLMQRTGPSFDSTWEKEFDVAVVMLHLAVQAGGGAEPWDMGTKSIVRQNTGL